MQLNMTERDKKLLVMLSIFVIVVCIGYWGIYPIIRDINDMNKEMTEQEDLQSANELKLSQVPMMEADNESWEADIQSAREQFFPMMTSAEIDEYFTDLVLGYDLAAYDLTISMPDEETDLEPYPYSERAALLEQQEAEQTVSTTTSESEESQLDEVEAAATPQTTEPVFEDAVMTGIFEANVSMRLGGDEADLQKLIEDLSNTDRKLRVCNYAWSEEKSMGEISEDGEYEIRVNRVLTLTLEIYMYQE